MPASSSASQEDSSSSRSWGSVTMRLARGDAEELGVEVSRTREEAALFRIARAEVLRVWVIEALDVPAAVGGELGDAVAALGDQLPELLGRADSARVAAGHADDRDRLLACLGADGDLPCAAARGRLGQQVLGEGG